MQLELLMPWSLLKRFDESVNADCEYTGRMGRRSVPQQEERVRQIVEDLVSERVFHFTEGREGHASFPRFDGNLLQNIDHHELHSWMTEHIKLWGSIYERVV